MKRLLLADHNAFTRRLVRNFLTLSGDWEICAEAADGNEAVEKAKFSHPDVAILDIAMPGLNGIEAARKIVESSPETAALTISMSDPNVVPDRLMQAGVRGFVSKYRLASELVPAIEALLEGKTYFAVPNRNPLDVGWT
ncbi:MAG: response regulator transcription factor [Candidatus Acidiferrales bacterium]